MSYSPQNHDVFSDRIKAAMVAVSDVIDREMEVLDDIYVNETDSGNDPNFVDTANGTAQEHTDAIVAFRAFQATYTAQLTNITPWLQ